MAAVTQEPTSSDSTDLQAKVRAAKEEMTRSIALAGLLHDPLKHPLLAMATMLEVLGAAAGSVTAAVAEAKTAVRKPISAEAEAEMVRRLSRSASSGASQQAASLVKAHTLRTVLVAAGVLVAAILMSAAGGYWYGLSVPINTNVGTLPREVVNLLNANDMAKSIAECKPLPGQPNGRKACSMNVWLGQ